MCIRDRNNIEHGFPAERRASEVAKHAKRLQRNLQVEPDTALRIARKQHGLSSVRPRDDAINRLMVIKESSLDRATHGSPWQQHGIRPGLPDTRRRAIETAKTYANKQRQDRKSLSQQRRRKKPQTAVNMMEKQDKGNESNESDDEQFPEKPDMHIFTLVDDDSDDELGEVDAHALQYMRMKTQERRLVLQAYENSKEHKKEALRLLKAPDTTSSTSIFDWSLDAHDS
eukprot:TRINITY_DN15589_c0_g1_i1.p1 TRINITY_DN15589_c0_g1~~TRINITY_DN15589_c0_g1_i1.p1  ORF type:complete len:228 (+),score=62.71 TRINITY_DN15589_c0_g1_i1:164-847(+)